MIKNYWKNENIEVSGLSRLAPAMPSLWPIKIKLSTMWAM